VPSLAVGLPADGESKGEPVPEQDVADQIHSRVQAPGLEPPIVVGHCLAAAAAGWYAATYPTRGIVLTGQATEGLRAFTGHCNHPGNGA
jgi:pimeloyl-ACP methyl ester carboxylesterase